jgi:hypothetical protein
MASCPCMRVCDYNRRVQAGYPYCMYVTVIARQMTGYPYCTDYVTIPRQILIIHALLYVILCHAASKILSPYITMYVTVSPRPVLIVRMYM